jgi:hypothetical protein
MRHASIQTNDEHLRKAMTDDSKRQAHSKVVEVLNGGKPEEKPAISAVGS